MASDCHPVSVFISSINDLFSSVVLLCRERERESAVNTELDLYEVIKFLFVLRMEQFVRFIVMVS